MVDGEREVGRVAAHASPCRRARCSRSQRAGAADLLVPLVRDAVRSVDVAAGVVDVDLAFLGEARLRRPSDGRGAR